MPTLLIANRGEIALRIIRTARQRGYHTAAVYSDADHGAPHVLAADTAVCIGGRTPQESYLDIGKLITAAIQVGADFVHPGYGFLSENAQFARACDDAGLVFVGPSAEVIELMGNKRRAKEFALRAGVPCIPGYQGSDDTGTLARQADAVGYPLMLKAAAGGGGKGMRVVRDASGFESRLASARAESLAAFGSDEIILEKALDNARHIEIQVFADQHGNCIHLGERDCSVQRRHQKVVEEAPSPAVSPQLREQMGKAAVALAKACHYTGAGTVEFLLDTQNNFYFLEMNTRLQVEHGVTELVTGIDLVAWQLAVAEGAPLPLKQTEIDCTGHAIEVRLYAENPEQDFLPQSGKIQYWQPLSPDENGPATKADKLRFDHALAEGLEISPYYDPMLGKLMAWGQNRDAACRRLYRALADLSLIGPRTNRFFLQQIIRDPVFRAGEAHTGFLSQQFHFAASSPQAEENARLVGIVVMHHLTISPADRLGNRANWQNGGPSLFRHYQLKDDKGTFQAKLKPDGKDSYSVSIRPNTLVTDSVSVVHANDSPCGEAALSVNGVMRTVQFALEEHRLTLISEGNQWEFSDITYAPAQVAKSLGSGQIRAPMEGNLTSICVEVGASVSRGDTLATMEAMKMEHSLTADCDGIVSAVKASAGGQVKSGQILIEIELATDDL